MFLSANVSHGQNEANSEIKICVNDVQIETDQDPYIDDKDRTQVPVRFVTEALGTDVEWLETERKVIIERGNNNLSLEIGNKIYKSNGSELEMDTAPEILSQNRTMVPLRFVSEALGEKVDWDPDKRAVYIYSDDDDEWDGRAFRPLDDPTDTPEKNSGTIGEDNLMKAVEEKGTPIVGQAKATAAQAQRWAGSRGAHQRFIDIAPIYWQIGERIGIRPEVAYAQSAKETAFGRYGGVVSLESNNWAGIKTRQGGLNEDPAAHETFDSPEEGVRAHYNHLAAYTGLEPVGEFHGRYHLVKSLKWAGTIMNVEELGERWAPNPDYGNSIVRDYLEGIITTEDIGRRKKITKVKNDNTFNSKITSNAD